MTTANRRSKITIRIGRFSWASRRLMAISASCFLFSTAALAEDQGFSALVNQIESHYHVKHTQIPLFGLIKPMFKLTGPAGAKTLDLAVFEEQDFSGAFESNDFENLLGRALGNGWHPFVRVHSRRDGELTCIYTKDGRKDCRLVIVTLERDEAVAMQLKLDPEKLMQWLENPERIGAAGKVESQDDLDE